MLDMRIRRARVEDRGLLHELWERAVRATHDFLHERDILALRPLVAEELARDSIDWWILVTDADAVIGFLGYSHDTVEALFIDPGHFRQGAGTVLVAHAQSLSGGALKVEVNEQNDPAVRFYTALGFRVVARSALDGDGRPFPILRMRRAAPA